MSVTHLLIHTVDVQRSTPTSVGKGKWRDSYVPHLSQIQFRISGMSASERINAQQENSPAQYVGYSEPGIDIKRDDIVTNITREDGTSDPNEYRVTGNVSPSIAHHTKVLLERIDKGAN